MSAAPIFSLVNLSLRQSGKALCQNLNLHIHAGERWGILGANGAGKTTLLHCLAGLLPPSAGHIEFCGKPLNQWSRRELAQRRGLLLQDQLHSFPARVRELVLQGRHPHQGIWQADCAEDHQRVATALEQTDLTLLADRRVDQLSGGERQRLAIASLLTQNAPTLLLDEPSNHLDLHYQIRLLEIVMRQSQDLGGACIASLHDLNLAARFCTHFLLLLDAGETAAGPAEAMLNENYLQRLYKHQIIKIENPIGRAFLPG